MSKWNTKKSWTKLITYWFVERDRKTPREKEKGQKPVRVPSGLGVVCTVRKTVSEWKTPSCFPAS